MDSESNANQLLPSAEMAREFWKIYRSDELELELLSEKGELAFDVFDVYEAAEHREYFVPLLRELVHFAVGDEEHSFIGTTVVEHAFRHLGPDVFIMLKEAVPSKALRQIILKGVQDK